jgi:hypothetical protein
VTELSWLGTPFQVALWAQLMLGAMLIRGVGASDRFGAPLRRLSRYERNEWLVSGGTQAAVALLMALVMAGVRAASLILGLWIGLCILLLNAGDRAPARRSLGAEIELGGLVLLLAGSAWITGRAGLVIRHAIVVVPWPANHVAVVCLAAAILLFAADGGTRIVRGVLNKTGTLPKLPADATGSPPLDTAEYNRGRLIGVLERLLLVMTVALSAYAALGFIIAAKGLIRIREFENRDFAEYFLIGTLTSVVVAFALGLALRALATSLW